MSSETAADWKAKGNAALTQGKLSEAVDCYTQAIRLDGTNHVYFSNRSAAYLKMGNSQLAFEDAESCIGLNPAFAKGYSRKGAALHALKRYNDSIAAYKAGLEKFPNDQGLVNGLESVQKEKDGPAPGSSTSAGGMPGGGLFGPQMMAQLAMNPKTRKYLQDEEFMNKIKLAQANPSMLPMMLQDPKVMEVFGLMMGQDSGGDDSEASPAAAPTSSPAPTSTSTPKKKEEPTPEPPQPEEDLSSLTPEERAKKETQLKAQQVKAKGNDFYKSKNFEKALEAYDEAIEIDPTNMTFWNNKAAVYFTQKKYDECIEMCEKALQVGKENMAPFEDRAKSWVRMAKAHEKKGDLGKAIECCKEAQLENYEKSTQRLMKNWELEKKKKDALSYQDPAKAEEAKQRGNDAFRAKDWPKAIKEYEDAVNRAPKNAAIRNNLAAALCKIMDFNGAHMHAEKAVELDPTYVKAWARKGDIEVMRKENHKAMESYRKGLSLDPSNSSCKTGLAKVNQSISNSQQNETEEQRKERAAHAMADPEIQAILQDPVMQQMLQDLSTNPNAAQAAMRDPMMSAKLEKLIAAGIVQTG